tara:strand:+ start:431 stop:688 length:258 start_codon:yes stop_codon:yes gene_type:complete
MSHKTTWQKCYDIESEIEYLGEENHGEHYFKIVRRETENFFDPEEDECYLLLEDGIIVGFEGYSSYPSPEEECMMKVILIEKNII